ncbi:MAG: 4'-phosphopantetheinyl transferase superfamily protein [Solirubrobacteraceae bacterium]|nr:4'-phosphopantetheinyl transferase superfamily protein [Solirubrobacteraceae bacterium]
MSSGGATPEPRGPVTVWWATRRPLADLDLSPLSREERARVDRLGTQPARERSALARALVRAALADALGGAPGSFQVGWQRGPALLGHAASSISISLSHSADRVVVALTEGAAVGVDIEPAGRGERLRPTVVERITTPDERRELAALGLPARERAAIQLWTAKEAVLKATREGLETEPHTVEILGLPEVTQLSAHARRPELVGACHVSALALDPDYVGSLAQLSASAPPVVERDADAGRLLS